MTKHSTHCLVNPSRDLRTRSGKSTVYPGTPDIENDVLPLSLKPKYDGPDGEYIVVEVVVRSSPHEPSESTVAWMPVIQQSSSSSHFPCERESSDLADRAQLELPIVKSECVALSARHNSSLHCSFNAYLTL